MLDYQRIVDDVRSSLYAYSAEGIDFLRAAAADYSVACDEVNERLRQCGSLLRQGLRSEAIQLGEIDPNVLDVAAILDFPERDDWIELAGRNAIAPPTPLLLDVASELNEAYAVEQPMAALLQRHRLLALARGSLALRIQIVRQLANLDPNNRIWQQDLQTFERERQSQLQAEVEAAARAGNTAALAALDAELSSPEWRNAPPPPLARAAADANTTLRYWAVQAQLESLAADLESAMAHGRIDLGKTLYDRWNGTIAESGWQPHEQPARRAAEAVKWVRNHLDHQKAVAALEHAVRGNPAKAWLEESHRRAVAFGPLAADLEDRYRARHAAICRAARHRLWLKIAGAVAAVAAALSLAAWIVAHEHHEREVVAAAENLPFLIERGEFERAETLANGLSAGAKRDPRLQEPLGALAEKLKHEHVRKTEFTQGLGTANHWLEKVEKALKANPNQTALARLADELERIDKDLGHARESVRTPEERTQLVAAEEFAGQIKQQWQRQLDETFLNQAEVFDKRLTQIEGDTRSSVQEQESKLGACRESLREWETLSTHVTPALVARINAVGERLAAFDRALQQRRKEDRDEGRITEAVGDIAGYGKALQDYVRNNPGADRAADFKQTADESLCWQAVAEWNRLAARWRLVNLASLKPEAAEEQLALAKAAAENFAECADCEGLRTLLPYVKAVAQRNSGGERIEAPLRKLLADPLVADAWMVEIVTAGEPSDRGRRRYYCRQRPPVAADSPVMTQFKYVSSFEGKEKTGHLREGEKVQSVGRAPQVQVAERIQAILTTLDDANWEGSFCQMVAVLRADRAIDPVLKANLLQQVLDSGVRGSHCLEKTLGRHLEWLRNAGINFSANWLDPTDPTVADDREKAERKLQGFPEVDSPTQAAAQDMKRRHPIAEFRWIGWLHRNRNGSWECLMRTSPDGAGPLLVVYRQPAGEKLTLSVIGRLERNAAIVTATGRPSLLEGRPVFLKLP
jgi:hypothetical protein